VDKRLLNFVLVSTLIFIGYMEILKIVRPAPEPAPDAVAEQAKDPAEGEGAPLAPVNDPANQLAEGSGEQPEPESDAGAEGEEASAEAEVEPDAVAAAEHKLFTLGSVDPASGYPMLITFNSKGAAVERIELSNPKYCDLYDKSAYIGHLGLSASSTEVTVVGDGTPAAKAGIKVGDTISKVGEVSVSNEFTLQQALAEFKYGLEVPVTINRDGASQTLSVPSVRRPLEVVRPESMPNGLPGMQPLSYLLTLHRVGSKQAVYPEAEIRDLPSLRDSEWFAEVLEEDGMKTIEFRFPLSSDSLKKIGQDGAVEVVKRFSIQPNAGEPKTWTERNYHFDFDLEFENKGAKTLELGYRLDGPTGLPLEGWWYSYKTKKWSFGGAGVRDVVWRADGGSHVFTTNPMVTGKLKSDPDSPEHVFVQSPEKLQYLGVDAQYFNSCVVASPAEDALAIMFDRVDARTLSPKDEDRASRTPVTFRADSSPVLIPANSSTKLNLQIFAGPKHPKVLDDYGLDECVVYGWFSGPAKIMGWLLHSLHWIVGNYGISIILLTVIVRACMFPLGRAQAMSAKKMQELTPEIKKIKEKYPTDTEKQAKAQQELFRKHKYNPVAGCLPMFLQLPLFMGLYRALAVDIELRQTPLIPGLDWCANLAGPDMLLRWDSLLPFQALTGYTGYLGPYLNLLPMISTGLFLVHQQMFTPPPTDEQQEMQQKVMKFMMLFMLVMFFKIPAGLCLYFITSSLWALGERLMLPKDDKKATSTPVSLADVPSGDKASSNGDGGKAAAAVAKKKRRKRSKK